MEPFDYDELYADTQHPRVYAAPGIGLITEDRDLFGHRHAEISFADLAVLFLERLGG